MNGPLIFCPSLIPDDVIKLILQLLSPSAESREEDRIAWGACKDGIFTNRSAYDSLLDQNLSDSKLLFKLIWSWTGPERYRLHLWKLT